MLIREAGPLLRPFVTSLWASNRGAATHRADRERVLPTGRMHLAFELTGRPYRLFENLGDANGQVISEAVIGGARAAPYFKDTAGPSRSVGAELRPGACEILFGVPAGDLAGRHTPLEAVWGPAAGEALSRLTSGGPDAEALLPRPALSAGARASAWKRRIVQPGSAAGGLQ